MIRRCIFYDYIYFILSFITVYFRITICSRNHELNIIKTGLETISPCSVALRLFADVNNTGKYDYDVEFTPEHCCLHLDNSEDCNILEDLVGCVDIIPSGKTKRLTMVAPLLDQYQRKGYCTAYLDSKSTEYKRNVMRNPIKIPFNTHIGNNQQAMDLPVDIKPCEVDKDPFKDCAPVDCTIHYNGKRPYYNKKTARCVTVPTCVTSGDDELPNVIYDPKKNECSNDDPVLKEDIDFIKDLVHGHERKPKDIVIIKNYNKHTPKTSYKSNMSTQFMTVNKDERKGQNKCKEKCAKACNNLENCKNLGNMKNKDLLSKILNNKLSLIVLGVVVLAQCILIFTMVYCLTKKCFCKGKKAVERKYFNYRQDVSVTTPLIGTSNIDTETTDFHCHSESSNVDQKIKCYKACQKIKNNDAKISLSDDILSKCLNRRDWRTRPPKSDILKEFTANIIREEKIMETNRSNYDKSSKEGRIRQFEANYAVNAKKASETVVNFENEISSKYSDKPVKVDKSVMKKLESKNSKTKKAPRTELNDSEIVLSERELKCHSYNYINSSDVTSHGSNRDLQPSSQSNTVACLKTDKRSNASVSTEKSAQASFSNDSIDDFLSERGMLYLAGEDISKYSFSIKSNRTKSTSSSDATSKTSKNNILKNVLSLLRRKSKHGPSSEPGIKKSKDNLDLEILHMSSASVFSSSNNNSSCLKTFKKTKDSRTSL